MLQFWRVAHPPVRGHRLCGTQPLVHVGFMKSWQAGNFNQKVINRIMELVLSCKPASDKLKIYVTGAHMIDGMQACACFAMLTVKEPFSAASECTISNEELFQTCTTTITSVAPALYV